MTVLEASKSTHARADGLAALRAGKTACSSTSPMSQSARDAHEQTLRDLLSRGANGHRDEPEPADGGRPPELIEDHDQAALTVTEVAFPLAERP